MKKIVALVLSLVMVLGLATTAFAATTSTGSVATTSVTPVKAAVYTLATAGGSMTKDATDVTTIGLTTVTGKVTNDVPMYVPNVYSINGDLYIQVAKAAADKALYNNGAYTYLADIAYTDVAAAVEAYATAVAMDKLVVPADDEVDCGDAYATVNAVEVPAAYYVSGEDVYYAANGNAFAYFNGEFVKYDATSTVAFKAHTWDATSVIVKSTDVKGVTVPVTIECEACEKTFPVVSALAFDNTWVKFVNYDTNAAVNGYYIVLNAVSVDAPAADAGDKVESAETFDAGIAMYVGMSVMAAAGSAVALKKKD